MKSPLKVASLVTALSLVAILAGCNLPGRSPTPFDFPTMDLTQTAVFNPTVTVPLPVTQVPTTIVMTATQNQPGAQSTNTSIPSNTPLPPTATVPPPTATNIPPTNTAVPPTATIPSARSNSFAVAPYISTAPKIDGSWTDLPSSSEKPANYIVYRNPAYTGSADPGMSYRIAWDNNYLYIGVKVGGLTYDQNATGQYIYQGDSIEILLDTNVSGDYYYNVLSPDDFQLGISPGFRKIGENPEAYLWFPSSIAGSRTNIKIAAINPSAGLFRIEVAIPWSTFEITPYAGMHLGFVLSFSVDASDSKTEQDLMVSNDKYRVLTDPTTWGDLLLTK